MTREERTEQVKHILQSGDPAQLDQQVEAIVDLWTREVEDDEVVVDEGQEGYAEVLRVAPEEANDEPTKEGSQVETGADVEQQ